MQGVRFTAPLLGNSGSNNSSSSNNAGFAADGTRSMLVFEGISSVHAFFDFMLNRAFTLSEGVCDVPVLLSPVQFTHAVVKAFSFSLSGGGAHGQQQQQHRKGGGVTSRTTTTTTTTTTSTTTTSISSYQLEVKGGMIPGWVADRMLCVLRSTQEPAGVTMLCDPLPHSVALNWHFSTTTTTTSAAADKKQDSENKNAAAAVVPPPPQLVIRDSGCVCEGEAQRWCTPTAGLDAAAVREVRYSQGSYTIMQTTVGVLPTTV